MTDPSAIAHLRSIDDSVRAIKRILIGWALLTILAAVIFLILKA